MIRLPVALAFACVLGAAGPVQQEHRPEQTRYPLRARCALNLIELSQWLQTFAMARDGMLPAKLSEVFVDTSGGKWRCLVCPGTKAALVEGGLYPSYAYVNVTPGGRKLEIEQEDILAFDAEPVHQGGRNVLFSKDMEVRYLEESEFQERLAEQRAKWEKRDKKLEVVRQDLIPLDESQAQIARENMMSKGQGHRLDFGHARGAIVKRNHHRRSRRQRLNRVEQVLCGRGNLALRQHPSRQKWHEHRRANNQKDDAPIKVEQLLPHSR